MKSKKIIIYICHNWRKEIKFLKEIHDKIGHVLAGNIMQLEACKILMEKDKRKK